MLALLAPSAARFSSKLSAPLPITARQPVKAIWTLLFMGSALVCLPVWMLIYLLPSARPNPDWSFKVAIMTKVISTLFSYVTQARIDSSVPPSVDAKKPNFVLVEPASSGTLRGILASADVKPSPIAAVWFPKPYEPGSSKRVLLRFHGGAFVAGDCDTAVKDGASPLLFDGAGCFTFSVGYRKACTPGNRFPAAVQDAVSAYKYLLDVQKLSPSQIIFSGDSAGANIVLALLRYISDEPDLLPAPAAALVVSPWVDLSLSLDRLVTHPNYQTDFVKRQLLQRGIDTYVPASVGTSNPYVSPLKCPFKLPSPIWVQAGSSEVFVEQIKQFIDTYQKVPGNILEFSCTPNANHDPLWLGRVLGFQREVQDSVALIHDFLQRHSR